MTVKDQFHRVSGLSATEHCVPGRKNPKQNGKRGCAQISAHRCESSMSTLYDHNFLVRTLINAFLDPRESLLSLEFNKIKCSAKTWAEHWGASWTIDELSVLVSRTSVFGIGLYLKCLGLRLS